MNLFIGRGKIDIVKAFNDYNKIIYGYILVRVNFKKEIAEDLTQEVFIKVLMNAKKFDRKKGNLKTWIFTIARNTLIDKYRQKIYTVDSNEKTSSLDRIAAQSDENKNVDEVLLMDYIKSKLPRLNAKERELITLRYVNDLSLQEMGSILKIKHSNLKMAVSRALKKLSELVNENEKNN